MQQLAEIAEGVLTQQQVLVAQADRLDLLLAGDEMAVPEERHPLGQRRRRDQHFIEPPAAQFDALFEFPRRACCFSFSDAF